MCVFHDIAMQHTLFTAWHTPMLSVQSEIFNFG